MFKWVLCRIGVLFWRRNDVLYLYDIRRLNWRPSWRTLYAILNVFSCNLTTYYNCTSHWRRILAWLKVAFMPFSRHINVIFRSYLKARLTSNFCQTCSEILHILTNFAVLNLDDQYLSSTIHQQLASYGRQNTSIWSKSLRRIYHMVNHTRLEKSQEVHRRMKKHDLETN